MNRELSELVVTDFRSIKGTVVVPLDAPIILIHGANGAGKTSIATALELALTGDVAALRRSDENVQVHLVNRDAEKAEVHLRVTGSVPSETTVTVRGGKIDGRALLDASKRTFFTDRCYLSQSTLGRLLDIYQSPASRDPTNTPLTNFVKSLLGLDALDALIDGLFPAGHKSRMSKLSADFDRADQLEMRLKTEQHGFDAVAASERAEAHELEARLAPLRGELDLPESLSAAKGALDAGYDPQLLPRLEARVNEVASLMLQWSSFPSDDGAANVSVLEAGEAKAATAAEKYRDGPGKRLAGVIASLRTIFPDIADPEQVDPEEARMAALTLVRREIARVHSLLSTSDVSARSLSSYDANIRQARARILVLDEQVSAVAGDTAGLGQALAALLPHIHDEICPVCHRDYSDQDAGSLRSHVAEEVTKLVGRSEQLRELTTERQQVQMQLAQAERDRGAHAARSLPQPDVIDHQQRLATLQPALSELEDLASAAMEAKVVRDDHSAAASRLAQFRLRDSTAVEIRSTLGSLAHTIGEADIAESETTQDVISRLLTATRTTLAKAKKLTEGRLVATEIVMRLLELQKSKEARDQETVARADRLLRLAVAQRAVGQERNGANALRNAASEARTAIVGRVFNEQLNAIWHDLFVRLAPNEPFVPAFCLPSKDGSQVAALLETLHREGGSYGRPGAMLSAGNLNTAALTLFLSLHLSVKPDLPWLILDDPVQSMDELHIAQFAALLRTLAKGEERQIMIAVHERQLFEYLTLELSPAFNGDRLITVEIGKSPEGNTRYETKILSYEPDRLVA